MTDYMIVLLASQASELKLSFEHLEAELARIDLLIQGEVQRWRLAGQNPADEFRGLYVSEAEIDGLLVRPLGGNWGQGINLSPEQSDTFAAAQSEAIQKAQLLIETAQKQGVSLRLAELQANFKLNQFELDTLLICLAPTLDLRYERFYSYLQDDVTRKRPSVNLVLNLLTEPGASRLQCLAHFADNASLLKYQILKLNSESDQNSSSLLSQTLEIDRAVVAWLLGHYQAQANLNSHSVLIPPPTEPKPTDLLLAGKVEAHLTQISTVEKAVLLVFYGPDRASQEAAAKLLAAQLGQSLLMVDLAPIIKSEAELLPTVRLALRDARLTQALPCLFGWDVCLTKEGRLPVDLLAELCNYPGSTIVAGHQAWQAEGINRERPLFMVPFPAPTHQQRLALWQHFLNSYNTENIKTIKKSRSTNGNHQKSASKERQGWDIETLAGQFALTTGQIRDTVASARDVAAQRGDPLEDKDLFLAARDHSNPRLAALARKIVPRYQWVDIVLPEDQLNILHEVVATVRGRPQVLEQWGVGQKLASSAAVTILFAGDPGTGKTMAAEVIAGELSLDLYKIDLSTLVSKYIGETEKNLEKIFTEAESSNAILFFDEADAIFGKRSEVKDAHDRYANIEISYLLQRMETYDGVTILATNLRANLDDAFTRRLQFAIDFPFPEREDRLRIWETLFPPDVPCDPELDFSLLARRFKLAGGNIRNIIVSAAYLAVDDGGQVTMKHLLHGTRREMQKMGRLISEDDMKVD